MRERGQRGGLADGWSKVRCVWEEAGFVFPFSLIKYLDAVIELFCFCIAFVLSSLPSTVLSGPDCFPSVCPLPLSLRVFLPLRFSLDGDSVSPAFLLSHCLLSLLQCKLEIPLNSSCAWDTPTLLKKDTGHAFCFPQWGSAQHSRSLNSPRSCVWIYKAFWEVVPMSGSFWSIEEKAFLHSV